MGRVAKPKALKMVQGTYRPAEDPFAGSPEVEPEQPAPPDFLERDGLAKWHELVPQLYRVSIMTGLDASALAGACIHWQNYVDAVRSIQKDARRQSVSRGLTIKTAGSNNRRQNPMLGIANNSFREFMAVASKFGLTPADRAKVKIDNAEAAKKDDPATRFFG